MLTGFEYDQMTPSDIYHLLIIFFKTFSKLISFYFSLAFRDFSDIIHLHKGIYGNSHTRYKRSGFIYRCATTAESSSTADAAFVNDDRRSLIFASVFLDACLDQTAGRMLIKFHYFYKFIDNFRKDGHQW